MTGHPFRRYEAGHVKAEVEIVTPEAAKQWLETAARNRPISDRVAKNYAEDMLAGRWMANGQGIVFSLDGQLLDGRHRLTAVILAQVEVAMLVVRGVAREAFETMDAGKSRSVSDVLAIEGRKNAITVAAAARLIWLYCAGVSTRNPTARSNVLALVKAHPRLEETVAKYAVGGGQALVNSLALPRSPFAAVLALAGESGKLDVEIAGFAEGVIYGEGLFKGDARLTLRRWLERHRRSVGLGQPLLTEPFFAACGRAWSAYARGEALTSIVMPEKVDASHVPIFGFERKLWADVPDLTGFNARTFSGVVRHAPPPVQDEAQA